MKYKNVCQAKQYLKIIYLELLGVKAVFDPTVDDMQICGQLSYILANPLRLGFGARLVMTVVLLMCGNH